MSYRILSGVLALLFSLSPMTSAAHAQEATTEDSADTSATVDSPAAVDPLDIRQGGGIPAAPPSAAAPVPPSGVLAAGSPPLTQQTADNFAGFVMWLLDAPLTQTQRQDLQDSVVDTWKVADTNGISTVLQLADAYTKLASLGDTERVQYRDQLQPRWLAQARQSNDDFSRWLLDIYNASHQPIAPGSPPLTRQMSDANAEVTYFVLQVVARGNGSMDGVQLEQSDFDSWASGLANDYPRYTPEQQQLMARMPLFRAAMTEGWKLFSDDQKASYRDAWRPIAEQWIGALPDPTFAALWDANLIENTAAHRARLETIRPSGCQPSASPAPPRQGSQAAYEQAMADLEARHSTYMMLSGGLMSNWVSNMNAINNIGNSPYTYVMK